MEVLRIEKLSKNFGGLIAINNISFSIKEEKRVIIIGPNGAGKTTLFNLISGAFPPSSGRVYIYSKDVTKLPQYERVKLGIARTYQVTNLFFNLPVIDNVILAKLGKDKSKLNIIGKLSSLKNLWEEAEHILEKWRMIEKKRFLVRDLSHGEQRQLEIILGLASKPKILLLDEPTSGLGKTETDLLISIIREFPEDILVLMIEHDMQVAFELAERIIVLHYGQIIADGKPAEIKTYSKVREAYLGHRELNNA